MIICDVCGAKSTCRVIFTDDDQRYDLCETHKNVIIDLISTPIRPAEPPRRKASKEEKKE